MQINKSDLKKLGKHYKNEEIAVEHLVIQKFNVQVLELDKKQSTAIIADANDLVKLMRTRLKEFEKEMSVKYGYNSNTHAINDKTGKIEPKPSVQKQVKNLELKLK